MDRTTLSMYAAFGVLSAGALPITAALRGLHRGDPTHRRAGRSLRTLGRAIVRATNAWDFSVSGAPPADLDRRPCVIVANHASLADPFLLSHLPFDQRYVAKQELFEIPLVGWLLRLAGDIPIRRGDHESAVAMERACITTLEHGLSVTIFPEGTRTKDGTLGSFRNGAFRIAKAVGVRVLPVALRGTAGCIVDGRPRRARGHAEMLAPIESSGRSIEELRDLTRAVIANALAPVPGFVAHEQHAPSEAPRVP
ncbi:MAG TPA: lysophospholipid acyltransferase family protein [Kofleriaceae bacterium]|nr:lysophospholipid acyltransferase family protein [Kofleriaceae bacterium]